MNNLLNKQGSLTLKLDVQEVGMQDGNNTGHPATSEQHSEKRSMASKQVQIYRNHVCICYVLCPRVFNKNNKCHLKAHKMKFIVYILHCPIPIISDNFKTAIHKISRIFLLNFTKIICF